MKHVFAIKLRNKKSKQNYFPSFSLLPLHPHVSVKPTSNNEPPLPSSFSTNNSKLPTPLSHRGPTASPYLLYEKKNRSTMTGEGTSRKRRNALSDTSHYPVDSPRPNNHHHHHQSFLNLKPQPQKFQHIPSTTKQHHHPPKLERNFIVQSVM